MKRALLLALICALLCACSPMSFPWAESGKTYTDYGGVKVTLQGTPSKTAVLFSSLAQVWELAGGTVGITVGESLQRGFAQNALIVDDGAGKTINMERLIAAKPDLVICSYDIPAQRSAAAALNAMGIPALCFRIESLEDYLSVLRLFCDITGNKDAYIKYGQQVAERCDALISGFNANGRRILFIRAGSGSSSTKAKGTNDHFVCGMLSRLNAHNIADDAPVLLDGLNLEAIISSRPEFIFISLMGNYQAAEAYMQSVLAQPAWRQIGAVRSGQYAFLPKDLFHFKPNHRWADAYQYLIELLNENE